MVFKASLDLFDKKERVVVDLGYAAKRSSCGIYWSGAQRPEELQFGETIDKAADCISELDNPILVLEAVLSTYHDGQSGNPAIRGDFEQGRGWYYGAGVLTFAAALRFLHVLYGKVAGRDIGIAEAFLSNKDTTTGHGEDARAIYDQFWNTQPEPLRNGLEAASPLVRDVPSVRVFRPQP